MQNLSLQFVENLRESYQKAGFRVTNYQFSNNDALALFQYTQSYIEKERKTYEQLEKIIQTSNPLLKQKIANLNSHLSKFYNQKEEFLKLEEIFRNSYQITNRAPHKHKIKQQNESAIQLFSQSQLTSNFLRNPLTFKERQPARLPRFTIQNQSQSFMDIMPLQINENSQNQEPEQKANNLMESSSFNTFSGQKNTIENSINFQQNQSLSHTNSLNQLDFCQKPQIPSTNNFYDWQFRNQSNYSSQNQELSNQLTGNYQNQYYQQQYNQQSMINNQNFNSQFNCNFQQTNYFPSDFKQNYPQSQYYQNNQSYFQQNQQNQHHQNFLNFNQSTWQQIQQSQNSIRPAFLDNQLNLEENNLNNNASSSINQIQYSSPIHQNSRINEEILLQSKKEVKQLLLPKKQFKFEDPYPPPEKRSKKPELQIDIQETDRFLQQEMKENTKRVYIDLLNFELLVQREN